MDFFEQTNAHVAELNENERKIFDFIVRNIHSVKEMQIRTLAANCYVSTTTIIRLAKKLGFAGYRDLIDSIRATCQTLNQTDLPEVFWKRTYSEEYLKNIIESVRVVTQEQLGQFVQYLKGEPVIHFLGCGLSCTVAQYGFQLFSAMGYRASLPMSSFDRKSALLKLKDGDIIFAYSFTGKETAIIEFIEQANLKCKPSIVSITRAGNNIIQNMSDLNFYVFSDQVIYNDLDITSRVSMIAVTEMLAYAMMTPGDVTPYTKM